MLELEQAAFCAVFTRLNECSTLTTSDIRNIAKAQHNGSTTCAKKVEGFLSQWILQNQLNTFSTPVSEPKPDVCGCSEKDTLLNLISLQTRNMNEFSVMMKDALFALQRNYDQMAAFNETRGKRPRTNI
jgi:hypothetical protein